MIPKLMHHIWVGPNPAPDKWLQTWPEKHPSWNYKIWGNQDLWQGRWHNFTLMNSFFQRCKFNAVADLMRYEILLRHGGIVVAADSVCLNPVDELFEDDFELYTIGLEYPGNMHLVRNRGGVTPLYAAQPGNVFTRKLVQHLHGRENKVNGAVVSVTGNRFMQHMIANYQPRIKIWPIHYFLPDHFDGWQYQGPDKVFARHFWGTTKQTYHQGH